MLTSLILAVATMVASCHDGHTCVADWSCDGIIAPDDVSSFVQRWMIDLAVDQLWTDLDGDYRCTPTDIALFVQVWFAALHHGSC